MTVLCSNLRFCLLVFLIVHSCIVLFVNVFMAAIKGLVIFVKLRHNAVVAGTSTSLSTFGAIAQLGERLHGMQEVSGSIPLSSTSAVPIV